MHKSLTLIKNSTNIVFASHINPDADTLGSALAMMHSLPDDGKRFTLYNIGEAPASLDFLPGVERLTDVFPENTDLVVALDCGDIRRLGLKEGNYKIINIDHHASNPFYGDENIVDSSAASTASVVLEFLRGVGIRPSKETAICLYAALASDTGFFKYDSVDVRAFLDAAYLVECGADASSIAAFMTEREPLSKIKLQSAILTTLKIMCGGKMAYLYMTDETIKACGAKQDEADGAAEAVRSIRGVEVSLFLRELEGGQIRGSLRSKSDIDVNKIAAIFDGGGHIKAAGFTVKNDKDFALAAEEIASKVAQAIGNE